MKKNPTRRPTIGDSALDALISTAKASGAQAAARASKGDLKAVRTTASKGSPDIGVVSIAGGERRSAKDRVAKARYTLHLPVDLMERVKNCAFWASPRVTLAGLAEAGIRNELERLEKKNGGPFKPRAKNLVGGRPIGS